MNYIVHIEGHRIRVELDGSSLQVDGAPLDVELASKSGTPVRSARVGDRSLRVIPKENGRGDWTLEVEGVSYHAQVLDARQEAVHRARKSAGSESGPAPLRAPMPGLVMRVEVSPGDVVERGDGIIIVEAMKMENELRAERTARVVAVKVHEGATVEKDQILVVFEMAEEAK